MERAIHNILVEARNELDRRGLAKGRLIDPDGRVCATGAIEQVTGAPARAPVVQALARCLPENFHSRHCAAREGRCPVCYNNEPSTTKEDVLALFDRAIAATAPLPEDIEIEPTTTQEPDLIPA